MNSNFESFVCVRYSRPLDLVNNSGHEFVTTPVDPFDWYTDVFASKIFHTLQFACMPNAFALRLACFC